MISHNVILYQVVLWVIITSKGEDNMGCLLGGASLLLVLLIASEDSTSRLLSGIRNIMVHVIETYPGQFIILSIAIIIVVSILRAGNESSIKK